MFHLVNKMAQTDTCLGRVISSHRSIEAAEKSDKKLQAGIRRSNGQNSYLPTVIVESNKRLGHGAWVYRIYIASFPGF